MKVIFGLALAALITLTSAQTQAQVVWQTPLGITADTDVSTNGTSVFAIAADATANNGVVLSINGVDFTRQDRASAIALGITSELNNDNANAFQAVGLTPGSDYATAVAGGWWGLPNAAVPGVNTLTGLTVGNEYEVQLWTNDSRNRRGTNFVLRLDGTTDLFLSQATDATGGVGQYIIGTFTAAATQETFTTQGFLDDVENQGRTQINMIQLRDITGGGTFDTGDVNCDGIINFLDIAPFIAALSAGDFNDKADIDRNGVVNFLDISPFISLLSSQ